MEKQGTPTPTKQLMEPASLWAFVLEHVKAYRLTGEEKALYTLRHEALVAFAAAPASIWHCLCAVFAELFAGQTDAARVLLEKLNNFRGHYRSNDYQVYMALHALWVWENVQSQKMKNAGKGLKHLIDHRREGDGGFGCLLLGLVLTEMEDKENALLYLQAAFKDGCRSSLLFLTLHRLYQKGTFPPVDEPITMVFLHWCMNQGQNTAAMTEAMGFMETPVPETHIWAMLPMLEKSRDAWLLKAVCGHLLQKKAMSRFALDIYEEAFNRQLTLPGLVDMLVHTACHHRHTPLNPYCVAKYLTTHGWEAEPEVKAFLFYHLLTDSAHAPLLEAHERELCAFAVACLDDPELLENPYIHPIFAHAYMAQEQYPLPEPYVQAMEEHLMHVLFLHALTFDDPAVTQVWVVEAERKAVLRYPVSDGKAMVPVVGEAPQFLAFSEQKQTFLSPPLACLPVVANAGPDLMLELYRRGKSTDEALLIALSRHMLAMETQEPEAVDVLHDALATGALSQHFTMQLSAGLGSFMYNQNRYDRALNYYNEVDENLLNDQTIEDMLNIFMATGEYQKAIALMTKKSHCIADRTLFQTLKILAVKQTFNHLIADIAYELVLKSWYDKTLVDVVLGHYKGSQDEWQALSQTLAHMSAPELLLDEIILKNSIQMHKLDEGAQKVFLRMVEHAPENPLVEAFATYCTYEMLVNQVKPTYDTLAILEKRYLQNQDKLLAYALCTVYIHHSVTTRHSDAILADTCARMVAEDVILPVFKDWAHKGDYAGFIMKRLPLLYQGQPNRQVVAHVRIDGEESYTPHPLHYLRFGLYIGHVTVFYGEKVTVYYSEETSAGSITSEVFHMEGTGLYMEEHPEGKEPYFTVNNALIYEAMFKYEQVEEMITEMLKPPFHTRGALL